MEEAFAEMAHHVDDRVFGKWVIGFWRPHGFRARVALILAATVCALIFTLAAQWLRLPPLPGFDGSLLLEPSPLTAILGVGVLLLLTTLVATILAGAVRFEAGFFAASMGMLTLSLRAGTSRSVIFESGGSGSVYFKLSFELLLLGLFLIADWALLWMLARIQHANAALIDEKNHEDSDHSPFFGRLAAIATQVVATAIILLFLCQSEAKNQVLASVGVASIAGALVAYVAFPARPSIWFWTGPLIVGMIGYLIAALGHDNGIAIGFPYQGTFSALARPLPIDYASTGPAGAILGYWMVRKAPHADSE